LKLRIVLIVSLLFLFGCGGNETDRSAVKNITTTNWETPKISFGETSIFSELAPATWNYSPFLTQEQINKPLKLILPYLHRCMTVENPYNKLSVRIKINSLGRVVKVEALDPKQTCSFTICAIKMISYLRFPRSQQELTVVQATFSFYKKANNGETSNPRDL